MARHNNGNWIRCIRPTDFTRSMGLPQLPGKLAVTHYLSGRNLSQRCPQLTLEWAAMIGNDDVPHSTPITGKILLQPGFGFTFLLCSHQLTVAVIPAQSLLQMWRSLFKIKRTNAIPRVCHQLQGPEGRRQGMQTQCLKKAGARTVLSRCHGEFHPAWRKVKLIRCIPN